jgi:hypothetical protein
MREDLRWDALGCAGVRSECALLRRRESDRNRARSLPEAAAPVAFLTSCDG